MKHDIFDLNPHMTLWERVWRASFLIACIAVLLLDLYYWRP
jgi:hypothetical protein